MPSANVRWPVPLTRQNPFYPGQMGVPGTDTETGLRLNTTGTIFYVDPRYPGASDARDGTNPTDPLLTVATALTKCQAHRGDVIAVMASGHWQYGTATDQAQTDISEEVVVDVPGVRIVGVSPSGALGVYWQPIQNDGVCITINALDVLVEGFCFWNEDFTGGTGVHIDWDGTDTFGDNAIVRHCHFDEDLDYGISFNYAYYCQVHDNSFSGIGIAAIHNYSTDGDPDYSVFARNWFIDCAAAINLPTTSRCQISNNWISGSPAVADSYITTNGGGLNLVSCNALVSTLAQYVGGNCNSAATDGWVQNFCVDGPSVALSLIHI